jgi:hypothetical protein
MKSPYHPKVRALLRAHPDGLTQRAIAEGVPGLRIDVARNTLINMPDAYIDRWADPVRGQWQAVWCVVVPPDNCPKPRS